MEVREQRLEETPSRERLEGFSMAGLSPEWQLLSRRLERPEFLPVPWLLKNDEGHHDQANGDATLMVRRVATDLLKKEWYNQSFPRRGRTSRSRRRCGCSATSPRTSCNHGGCRESLLERERQEGV